MNEKTTVIVVSYNHAAYVDECLDSIRQQTVQPARVLIADDCSPDGITPSVITDYLAKHPGFGEFHPNAENIGLTATLNAMLRLVDTEYFTYIAADDYMQPERIETLQALLDQTDPATVLAYSDALVVDADGSQIGLSSSEFPWPHEPERSQSTLAQLVDANWIPAASMFMRTDSVKNAGGYAENLFFEDIELLTRLARTSRFAYSTKPLVTVRRLNTSLGAIGFDPTQPRFIRAQFYMLRNALGLTPELDRRVLRRQWELAIRARRAGNPWTETLWMTASSLRGAPSTRSRVYRLLLALLPKK